MDALEGFLQRLRADPTRALQKEFEEFLVQFKAEKEIVHLDQFLKESKETQEEIVHTFLNLNLKIDPKQPYALPNQPLYTAKLEDFLGRVELGDEQSKKRFESFLSSWEQKGSEDFERFVSLPRTDQEAIFSRFREEELPDTRAHENKEAVDVRYDRAPESTVQYNRDTDRWRGQVKDPDKKDGGFSGSIADFAQSKAKEPNRLGDSDEENPFESEFR